MGILLLSQWMLQHLRYVIVRRTRQLHDGRVQHQLSAEVAIARADVYRYRDANVWLVRSDSGDGCTEIQGSRLATLSEPGYLIGS